VNSQNSAGGDAREGSTGAKDVLELENKVLGLPPYKESVGFLFFSVFPTISPSPNFVAFVTLNFILTNNLKIDSSYF
jgi:hypothetical protein